MKAMIAVIILGIGLFYYSPGQDPAEIIISSIGIDFVDGEYEVSLFSINTKTISKVETVGTVQESHSVIVHKSTDLGDLISELSNSSYRKLSFSQLSSMVVTTNTLGEIELLDIINVFRYSILKYMNIYLYVTEEKIEDVFNIGNIENLSLYYSLLVDPMYKYSIKSFPKPLTVIGYLRDYYNYNEIKIPVLSKSEVSIVENENDVLTIVVEGFYFDKVSRIDYDDSDKSLVYVDDFELTSSTINGINIDIKNYKINAKCKNDTCSLDVMYVVKINSFLSHSDVYDFNKAVENKITNMLKSMFEKYKQENIDIFNLKESIYRSENKVLELQEIVFEVNVNQMLENAHI